MGLFGAGYFGNFHIDNLLKTNFDLVGFYDTNIERAEFIQNKYKIPSFTDPDKLISEVDAIDIATPTVHHFNLIKSAITAGKHVFVEKPITANSEQATEIIDILDNNLTKLQVGHIERYNPAVRALNIKNEKIINLELNRYSQYNIRGTDVSVVFDLMIHDIDLLLHLKKEKIIDLQSTGFSKFGKNIEFARASFLYEDGTMATLNSSIIHPYNERKMKIWTKNDLFEIDLNNRIYDRYNYLNKIDEKFRILNDKESISFVTNNAILEELNEFYDSIKFNRNPRVSANDGFKSVKLAEEILHNINTRL